MQEFQYELILQMTSVASMLAKSKISEDANETKDFAYSVMGQLPQQVDISAASEPLIL